MYDYQDVRAELVRRENQQSNTEVSVIEAHCYVLVLQCSFFTMKQQQCRKFRSVDCYQLNEERVHKQLTRVHESNCPALLLLFYAMSS